MQIGMKVADVRQPEKLLGRIEYYDQKTQVFIIECTKGKILARKAQDLVPYQCCQPR